MADSSSYHTLRKLLLKIAEQVSRYQHHIVFISTYIKFNRVPKGFQMRHHSNIEECHTDSILKKCSKKLMLKTIQTYKRKLKVKERELIDAQISIKELYSEKDHETTSSYNQRVKNLCSSFSSRRAKKFERDGLTSQPAQDYSSKLLESLIQTTA